MTSATIILLLIGIILIGSLAYRKFAVSKTKTTKIPNSKIHGALLGVAIGDAVGVPYEFSSREKMVNNPAKDMIAFGTHDQPKGTWSDDSSLTFCLAEALVNGYDLKEIATRFIKWKNEAYWSARGEVFDIGFTTKTAINRLDALIKTNQIEDLKNQKYYGDEFENGNGSLMRILPLLFYIKGKPIKEQFEIVWEVSALTHRHIRAAMSCLIYLKLAEKILNETNKEEAYSKMRAEILSFWEEINFNPEERIHFEKIIQKHILKTPIEDLRSGGYVIEVLESSIWFFLKENNYKNTILSIINIGHDTDTSAAIAGGLAGLFYGTDNIPKQWVSNIAGLKSIILLGNNLYKSLNFTP